MVQADHPVLGHIELCIFPVINLFQGLLEKIIKKLIQDDFAYIMK